MAALMTVENRDSQGQIEMHTRGHWRGLTVAGDFGRVEGWIRLAPADQRPPGFETVPPPRDGPFCARTATGDILVV